MFICNDKNELGVLAGCNIKRGEFIIEFVGECLTNKMMAKRKKTNSSNFSYWLKVGQNKYIDAKKKGNLSRFINHSCMENGDTQVFNVNGEERVGIFACRDIALGDEIFINYNNRSTTYVFL